MKISQAIVFLSILIVTLTFSCSTKPRSILDEKKMSALLKDMYKAEGIFKKDSKYASYQQKDALVDAVFRKHKVTYEQYEKSLDWYAENIEIYNAILDSVSARLQREYNIDTEEIKDAYKYKLSGFTTELPEYFVLDNNNPTFRFRIDSVKLKTFESENFKFSFNTKGVDTVFHKISAVVYFKYRDTMVVNRQNIFTDSLYIFAKPTLSDSLLKEISGYVHLQMANKMMPKVLLSNILNKTVENTNKSDSINVPINDSLDIR